MEKNLSVHKQTDEECTLHKNIYVMEWNIIQPWKKNEILTSVQHGWT